MKKEKGYDDFSAGFTDGISYAMALLWNLYAKQDEKNKKNLQNFFSYIDRQLIGREEYLPRCEELWKRHKLKIYGDDELYSWYEYLNN